MMPAEWAFLLTNVGALLCWAIPCKYTHLERSSHTSVSLLPTIPSYYFKVPVHLAKLSASMNKDSIYTLGPVWEKGGRIDWEKPLTVGQSEKLPHLATMNVKYEFVERLWATTFTQPQSGSLLRHFDAISDHHKLLGEKKANISVISPSISSTFQSCSNFSHWQTLTWGHIGKSNSLTYKKWGWWNRPFCLSCIYWCGLQSFPYISKGSLAILA